MALEEVPSKSAFNGIHEEDRASLAAGDASDWQSSLAAKLKLQEEVLWK